MRNASGQLAYGIHLLRSRKLLLRFSKGALGLHPLGDVARNLGEAQELALIVPYCIYHDRSTKLGAVLAHPPTLGLVLAFATGSRQCFVGDACCLILFGVELAEMQSDDLVRRIAFDALRAGVAGRNDAIRIKVENGVIDYAFHQLPEPHLAFQKPLLGLPAFGHVPRDLNETEQFAVLLANGVEHCEPRTVIRPCGLASLRFQTGPFWRRYSKRFAVFLALGPLARKMRQNPCLLFPPRSSP